MEVISRWVAGDIYLCVEQNSGSDITVNSWRYEPMCGAEQWQCSHGGKLEVCTNMWSRPVAVVSLWIAGGMYQCVEQTSVIDITVDSWRYVPICGADQWQWSHGG